MYKVLLIDDELETLNDRSEIILNLGYECATAINGDEAIKKINEDVPDVVLTDLKMPEKDGFEVLKTMKEIDANVPVVIFTGYGTIESAVEAIKLGAYDFIQKPFPPEMMEVVLKKALDYRKLKKENVLLKSQIQEIYRLDTIIGNSKAINNVIKRILKVAKTDSTVLIYGESGTGKELVARSIHEHSTRSDEPFIPLDCGALPSTLLESEIFGFEQGAFTGASKSKPGMFELADGGTLFLDEITELDINLQSKLLRVLQERQFRRIGGMKLIDVDVRILSATNMNPIDAVANKKLRQDLYYRLNVVPIFLPPLRNRKEDIPLLVNHFLKKYGRNFDIEIKGFTKDALNCLSNYDWPGNIRELENIIEQTMSLTEKEVLTVEDLPETVLNNSNFFPDQKSYENLDFREARDKFLTDFSKRYIENLMKKYDGNISKVARNAHVSRRTIYRILNK